MVWWEDGEGALAVEVGGEGAGSWGTGVLGGGGV